MKGDIRMHDVDFYRDGISKSLRRMQELARSSEDLDLEQALSWKEFSKAMHEALDAYDANCREAERIYNEEFSRLCG